MYCSAFAAALEVFPPLNDALELAAFTSEALKYKVCSVCTHTGCVIQLFPWRLIIYFDVLLFAQLIGIMMVNTVSSWGVVQFTG